METMDSRIELIVNRIQKIYFIIVCSLAIAVFFNGIESASEVMVKPDYKETLQGLLSLIMNSLIYFGLRFRNQWVIPLILISASYLLIMSMLSFIQPADNALMLASKIIIATVVLFCAYQIYFFQKREVKSYFRTKGVAIF